MLVDEEMLAKYRKAPHQEIEIRSLPEDWFSHSDDLFEAEWAMAPDGCPSAVTPVLAYTRMVPRLQPAYTWHALWHQSGGYTTHANYMVATPLTPNRQTKSLLDRLAGKFYCAENGRFDRAQTIVSLIVDYVGDLKSAGLDCEGTWRILEEAIYPVDATQSNPSPSR